MNHLNFRKIITRFGQLPFLLVPVLILGAIRMRILPDNGGIFAMQFMWLVLCTMFICYLLGSFIKFLYFKERPEPRQYKNWWKKIDASSFPSVHTAQATVILCASFLIAKVLYQPHIYGIDKSHLFSLIVAYILSMVAGLFYILIARSRLELKKHFLIDVVYGTVLGLIAVIFAVTHMDTIFALWELIFGR